MRAEIIQSRAQIPPILTLRFWSNITALSRPWFTVLILFVSILFYFTLILLKLEHALITTDVLNQNPTKKVMLQYKGIVLTRCRKWLSFQSDEYNHDWWDSYDKNHLAQEAVFYFLFNWTTMTVHSNVFENLLLVWLLWEPCRLAVSKQDSSYPRNDGSSCYQKTFC